MNARNNVNMIIERLGDRYNPEFDRSPGMPDVTSSDMGLVSAIYNLLEIVDDQQKQIDELEEKLAGLITELDGES